MASAQSLPAGKAAAEDCYQSFVVKLSENLGVDKDKVTKALDTTKKQMLEEAVQQGKLTRAQADKIASKPGIFCSDRPGPKPEFHKHGYRLESMASILGITTDQLKAELKAGKTLQRIITEHGMTTEQFKKKMLDLKKEKINSHVKEGKITQEQANTILKKYEQRLNKDLF